jgi:hypothetical protein
MYSWEGVGQKAEWRTKKISEYLMAYEATKVFAIRPENEDAIYKQKYAYFTHRHITEACSAVGSSTFFLGG